MRHSAQQRRLERVASPQGLCLERLGLEPAALGDDREQGGERREEAAPDRLVDRRLLVHEKRRDAPQPRFDGQGLLALLRRLLAELESCALDTEHARRERREPP